MNIIQCVYSIIAVAGLCLFLSISGCGPKVENGGYIREDDFKGKVLLGKSTKEDVRNNLGSPSAQSTFGDETWYYVTARKETVAFFKPEVVKQDVTEIAFDSKGIVSKINNYTKDDGEDIAIAKRTTPTEGHTMGFMEQVLGNLGRFNHPTDSSGVAPGRQPDTSGAR